MMQIRDLNFSSTSRRLTLFCEVSHKYSDPLSQRIAPRLPAKENGGNSYDARLSHGRERVLSDITELTKKLHLC
jgi:hypothetical protein